MISADIKANKTRNERSGGSAVLQIFIRLTFRTSNTSPNNVNNLKKYPLFMLMTYFDTTYTVLSSLP